MNKQSREMSKNSSKATKESQKQRVIQKAMRGNREQDDEGQR